NARTIPNQSSYTFYGRSFTWEELNDKTQRFAQYLKNLGINKGDRVALYMQNSPQYLIAHYAIQMLGAVVLPLNPMYKEAELEYLLNEVEISGIIAGQELYNQLENIKGRLPSLEFVILTNYADLLAEKVTLTLPEELLVEKATIKGTLDMIEAIEESDRINSIEKVDIWEDIGLMVFTSGTTGRPKAAMLT